MIQLLNVVHSLNWQGGLSQTNTQYQSKWAHQEAKLVKFFTFSIAICMELYTIYHLLIGNVHKPTRSTKKVQLDVTILNYTNSWKSLNGRNIALTKQYSIWYLHQMLSELSELSCVCHRCGIFHYHTPIVLATCCHLHIMSILGQIMTLIGTCQKCKQNI